MEEIMAEKKTILEGRYQDRAEASEYVNELTSLTWPQRQSVLLCLIGLLPANVRLEQRSAFGPVDVTVDNFRFKVSQRAKVTQRYEMLP
jgi:hypothetical protein